MKTKLFFTLSLLIGLNLLHAQETLDIVPNQYIVTVKSTVAQAAIITKTPSETREGSFSNGETVRATNLAVIQRILIAENIDPSKVSDAYADALVGFAATLTTEEVQRLKLNPNVEDVFEDYYISLGPIVEEVNPKEVESGQTTTCAITNAGGFQDGSDKATVIWILDSGIDLDHPDLNVVSTAPLAISFIPGQSPDDGNGHGTHCAGIAAAKNNSFGVVGVSAGAKVVPVKILNNTGNGQWSQLLSGLNHVAKYDKANDVINMSLGGYGVPNCENSNIPIRDAIRNLGKAGVWVCMAAGNNACDAVKNFPGCVNGNRVFTVASMNCAMTCSTTFSNFQSTVVDWVATGEQVYSTYKNGGYATLSGTSMASPVVAGICHARANAPANGGLLKCGNNCVPAFSYKKARRM